MRKKRESKPGSAITWDRVRAIFDNPRPPRHVTADYVNEKVASAAARLKDKPEWELAPRLQADLPHAKETVELRIDELLSQIKEPGARY